MEIRALMKLSDGADDVASTVRFRVGSLQPGHPMQLIIAKVDWELLGRPDTVVVAVQAATADGDPVA
jgi:hypothetical protein